MHITVASGKGGVGKTTITAGLAYELRNRELSVVDCDVDAPNLAILLGVEDKKQQKLKAARKAVFDMDKCTKCGICLKTCQFEEIGWEKGPKLKQPTCEGCGACILTCPENAIHLEPAENSTIITGKTRYGFPITYGQLNIGASGSGMVVTEIKKQAQKTELMLFDAAAGVGCPVIASIRGSDYVILVTEPTPAALSDLKKALRVVDHFNIPRGLVINKSDIGELENITEFAKKNNLEILAKISHDKEFIKSAVECRPVQGKIFKEISDKLGL